MEWITKFEQLSEAPPKSPSELLEEFDSNEDTIDKLPMYVVHTMKCLKTQIKKNLLTFFKIEKKSSVLFRTHTSISVCASYWIVTVE